MASVTTNNYYVSPTMRFVDDEGRLTKNGFDLIKAAAQIVSAITIEDGEITTDKIAADAVTADKISVANLEAISATLGNVTVNGSLLVNGSIETTKYNGNSIIITAEATNTSDFGIGSGITTCSVNLTPNGGKVVVTVNCIGLGSGDRGMRVQVRKNGVAQIDEEVATCLSGKFGGGALTWVDTSPGTSTNTYSCVAYEGFLSGSVTHIFSSISAQNHKNA